MARPRPTPPIQPAPEDPTEFERPIDLQLRSGGPRDFARLTTGSKMISGRSEVKTPEPQ